MWNKVLAMQVFNCRPAVIVSYTAVKDSAAILTAKHNTNIFSILLKGNFFLIVAKYDKFYSKPVQLL